MAKKENMAMVLQAFRNVGLSDNQARILAAEVGRENGFQDKYLWGYHKDPKNNARNVGMISWQGTRGKAVEDALRSAGLLQNGKIAKGQAALDVMAQYMMHEIRTDPKYAQTRKQFLENPDVDYATGTRVLGKNFIRWRYDDPRYASGHASRDKFYQELGGIVPAGGQAVQAPAQDTGGEGYVPPSTGTAQAAMLPDTSPTRSATDAYQAIMDLFAGLDAPAGSTLLQGATGLVAPSTSTENSLFSKVADMNLADGLEGIYAEAARAIAAAKDKLSSRPMIQSRNPLRAELGSIFDSLDV